MIVLSLYILHNSGEATLDKSVYRNIPKTSTKTAGRIMLFKQFDVLPITSASSSLVSLSNKMYPFNRCALKYFFLLI